MIIDGLRRAIEESQFDGLEELISQVETEFSKKKLYCLESLEKVDQMNDDLRLAKITTGTLEKEVEMRKF
jgi:hypothetical protein